jgi:hypothetical protein
MRYTNPGDHHAPWPDPESESHAVSGHHPPVRRQYWPWWVIGSLILMLIVGLCVVMGISLGTGHKDDTTGYVTPSPAPRPTSKAASKAKSKAVPEVQKIDEGMFKVGTDVQPGRYKTPGMKEDALMCYWHTAKDTSTDKIEDQGVVDKVGAQAYVTLKKGKWFQTSGCETWVRQAS